jgi:hypothetical protein
MRRDLSQRTYGTNDYRPEAKHDELAEIISFLTRGILYQP